MSERVARVAYALLFAVFALAMFGSLSGCVCVDYYRKCEYDPKCCVAPQACPGEPPKS